MKKAPFLSIVVLAYQVESYLDQCLTSIVSQTFSDFEVLLIDDGSIDSTPFICDTFAGKDPRIRVVHQVNKGIVAARKVAVNMARGSYIASVDGDDWIEKDMFQILSSAAKETRADIVQCNAIGNYPRRRVRLEVAGLQAGFYKGEEYILKIKTPLMGQSLVGTQKFFNSLCNKIIRRELLLDAFLGMDDRCVFGEDAACSLFCAAWSNSMVHIDSCLYHYRQRPDSSTHGFDPNLYENILILRDFMISRKNEFEPHVANQMELVTLRLLVMAFGLAYVYSKDPLGDRKDKIKEILSDKRVRAPLKDLSFFSQASLRYFRLLLILKLGLAPFKSDVTLAADKTFER